MTEEQIKERERKGRRDVKNGKGETTLSSLPENKVVYMENEKNVYKKIVKFKLLRGSSKAAKYKINTQNSTVFFAAVITNQKMHFKKHLSPLTKV